ncbi:hypothetical protein M3Y95_00659900 [Aphelenchoides besseyi]|nr:hypothetical protein M3Y95_00659900 [Aphelenchoides besseyi]
MRLHVQLVYYTISVFISLSVGLPLKSSDSSTLSTDSSVSSPQDLSGDFRPQRNLEQQKSLYFRPQIYKRRLSLGMPNLLHLGSSIKRMIRKRTVRELHMNKRRIGMSMPNILFMRQVDKRPNLLLSER